MFFSLFLFDKAKLLLVLQALNSFNQILRSSTMELNYQLTKGTVVVFDNFRVLHGRSSFTGKRRMVGCYLNHDDFRSRAITLLGDANKAKK